MKKILISTLCLLSLSTITIKAQQAIAVLHHEGKATVYTSAQFNNAFEAAVDGDTIFLSEGVISNTEDLTISKKISVIGAGMGTYIAKNVKITAGPESAHVLKNVDIGGSLNIEAIPNQTLISQCRIGNELFLGNTHEYPTIVDRCYIKQLYLNSNPINVVNSKIELVLGQSSPSQATITNCNIQKMNNENGSGWSYTLEATYTNCLINDFYNYEGTYSNNTTFINCLIHGDESQPTISNTLRRNCWYVDSTFMDTDLEATISLASYTGTDGTVIGCNGGAAPYTLTPSVPRVTNQTISVDNTQKTLNVTLTIGN